MIKNQKAAASAPPPVKLALQRDVLTLSAASAEQATASEELDGDRVKYESGPSKSASKPVT